MASELIQKEANFGTTPVFFTAISTILGAILFLRFGWAVGNVGFIGVLGLILLGHLITIPTAMAVAEIATNQKVQGGGANYIISRSFGLNIGGAVGITLYLSQAISVAFYVIAFAEAFDPLLAWVDTEFGIEIPKRIIALVFISLLALLVLTKGANVGMKALYGVVLILGVSLLLFFMGKRDLVVGRIDLYAQVSNPESFFYVFTIVFPAFIGLAAGLGLSGDLKDPKKAIPRETIWATAAGLWYISLIGAILSFWVMFKMNTAYAVLSISIMGIIYYYIASQNRDKQGLANLFRGVGFQLSRQLQIFMQRTEKEEDQNENWRPFVMCISKDSFKRRAAFEIIRWISFKYGFGTYIHFIEGRLNKSTNKESKFFNAVKQKEIF